MLDSLVSKVTKKVGKPNVVAVDAGYKTPYIAKFLLDQEIRPVMPYTRPRTKAGYLKRMNTYMTHILIVTFAQTGKFFLIVQRLERDISNMRPIQRYVNPARF